ncbi:helix-turn-helix domain-containing protein [Microbacterium thalli]|uniref:helix-turn-helix domain-containing protein n=1 Tax=Microbacterium thalli TaxID=3027921 RepID=UPI002366D0EA|nr:helix-turn-helix domain-containing protein [Microbacterium thalli]MDD7929886.1 helix-turn-helix domain-containing protein [Microbacterium thalli]
MSVLDDLTLDELLAYPDPTPVTARRSRKLTLAEMRVWPGSANASDKRTSVSATQYPLSTSDNLRPSRAYRDEEIDALVVDLVAARAARRNRKAMRRPFRRRGQADLFDVVRLHLRRLSRRVLNDRCRDGLEPPEHDLLVLALERYLEQQCWPLVYVQEYGDVREPSRVRQTYLDGERAIESVARSCARYALDNWSPDWILEMRRRGAKGGRTSKRRPSWTDHDLDALAALDGLTVAAQARTLGRSPSTVDRMRRALRERG